MAVTLTEAAARHVSRYLASAARASACAWACKHHRLLGPGLQARVRRRGRARGPCVREPRREGVRRPEEPAVHRRHRARLRARRPERRLQVQQPEREGPLRLRRIASASDAHRRSTRGAQPAVRGRLMFDESRSATTSNCSACRARFALDRAGARRALDASCRREVHPDRFAAAGAAAQRVAMQWAVRVNEAYQRLKDPLQARGLPVRAARRAIDAENNTAMPADFLMQQMEWREALDEAQHATDELRARWTSELAARRSDAAQRIERRCSTTATIAAARAAGASPDVPRALRRRRRRPPRRSWDNRRRPWPCCRSPNPASRPTRTSAASRSASTSAPPIRWSPRCATASPSACPTTQGRVAAAVGRALPAPTATPRSATRRRRAQAERPDEHHRLGQALHGPRPGRHRARARSCRTTSSTRRAWCSCSTVAGVKVAGRGLGARSWPRCASAPKTRFDDDLFGAVITVPAYFDDAQRQATKDAAQLAGLNVLRLINEPTAAAIAYGLDNASRRHLRGLRPGRRHLRHLDPAPVARACSKCVATGGDSALGGDDFDQRAVLLDARAGQAARRASRATSAAC